MKKMLTLCCVFFCLIMTNHVHAQKRTSKTQQAQFLVLGNCEMCKNRIEKAALTVKGVKMAQWNIPSNILKVVYNAKKLDSDLIHQAVANVGHDTQKHKAPEAIYAGLPLCCLYERIIN